VPIPLAMIMFALLLTVGILCVLFPKNVQNWVVKWLDRQTNEGKSYPFSWYVRDELYLAHLLFCGIIALIMAIILLFFLIAQLKA
jgi:hypothetical protein